MSHIVETARPWRIEIPAGPIRASAAAQAAAGVTAADAYLAAAVKATNTASDDQIMRAVGFDSQ